MGKEMGCVTIPVGESERDLDPSHEGGLYLSIKGREDGGGGDTTTTTTTTKRKRSERGEGGAGIRGAAVHSEHGEIALLDEADQVRIYGESYGRHWVFRLKSDWQKENAKQRDQQLSVWLQALRAKLVRPEDCAQAIVGTSLDGSGIYAVVSLHRPTSYKSFRGLLCAATGVGGDPKAKASVALEIRQESEKGLRAMAGLVEASTQSTFSLGLEAAGPLSAVSDRRKQKADGFKDVEISRAGSLAETAVLTSDIQYKATEVSWRPAGGRCLAVGCNRGVCLWHIKTDMQQNSRTRHPLGYLDSSTEMIFLQCHGQVRSMSWSPCGRLLVVSVNKPSAPLLVWDVSLAVNTKLSSGLNKGVAHFLKWSPCGDYLLVATESGSFFIWETHNWTFQQWSFKHRMKDAVWITDHNVVLASFEGLETLQQIRLSQSAPSLNIHLMQLSLPGVSGVMDPSLVSKRPITSMCWDAVNDNLVVNSKSGGSEGEGNEKANTKLFPSSKIIGSDKLFGRSMSGPGLLSWNAKESKLAATMTVSDSKVPTVAIYSIRLVPVVSATLQALVELD
ncbi:hypothetical protein HOP50_02g18470 [Chloropicon primus]|uniref:WD40 repeat domain-containing protein n=1 Tax=Chloropicon primus TaxID=1764295 RepID=A0A5B8MJ07_9CHLO|nr:hypothetical protein A3770_02p18500 [Chloropicon primus]UPQ98541.1 hypothetical protein HOP50_02g18470 [Chloropicon primus]|eukprot:QDZ19332.1 hypothetical protein A3770_02p18500 [Chloropicon primus]